MNIPPGRDPIEFLYQEALELVDKKEFSQAQLALCDCLAQNPGYSEAESLLGFCNLQLNNVKYCIANAQAAIHHDPSNAHGYHVLALGLRAIGQKVEALDAVQSALNLEPARPEFLVTLAYLHMDCGSQGEAMAAAALAHERDPALVSASNALALLLMNEDRWGEAGKMLLQALEQNPREPTTLTYMGWVNLNANKPEAALKCFALAYQEDSASPTVQQGLLLALKGSGTFYGFVLNIFAFLLQKVGGLRKLVMTVNLALSQILPEIPKHYPKLAAFIAPLMLLWRIFTYFVWTIEASFTLILRLNRHGRMLVTPKEKLRSNIIGGCWLLALGFWCYHYYVDPFTYLCRLAPPVFITLPLLWVDAFNNTASSAGKFSLAIIISVTALAIAGLVLVPFKIMLALSLLKYYFYSLSMVLLVLSLLSQRKEEGELPL